MTVIIHKVTCFITRIGDSGTELLLFNHPDVGIQIPAGTVNPGEDPIHAAYREAAEESSLADLVLVKYLGDADDPIQAGYAVVAQPTLVYSRPNTYSMDWAHFPVGIPVEKLRCEAGFTQVRYEERFENLHYIAYSITGWVLDDHLTYQRTRHFFLFNAPNPTPNRWSNPMDYTIFELFWAPVENLPSIFPPQNSWLKWLMGSTR